MSSAPVPRPIALVGMMGTGKTTVGRLLAARLGLKFLDSDAEVERRQDRLIATIFAEDGEPAFRLLERETIESALTEPVVLATGGGAMAEPETREILLTKALTIWLDAPAEILAARLAEARNRPLLKGPESLAALLDKRRPAYAQADIRIDADGAPAEIVETIIRSLEERATP